MELKHSGKTAKRTVSSGQSNRQVPGKGTATPGQRRKSRWTTGTSAREKDLWGEGGGGVQKGLGLDRSWQPNTQSQETGVCVEHLPTVFYVQGTIHILSHLTPIASLYMLLVQFYRLRKKLIWNHLKGGKRLWVDWYQRFPELTMYHKLWDTVLKSGNVIWPGPWANRVVRLRRKCSYDHFTSYGIGPRVWGSPSNPRGYVEDLTCPKTPLEPPQAQHPKPDLTSSPEFLLYIVYLVYCSSCAHTTGS